MAEIYRYFGRHWEHVLDFSDDSLIEHYNHISYGTPCSKNNGFMVGEKWTDVNVGMWRQDRANGLLPKHELYSDPNLPDWWLDKVLN